MFPPAGKAACPWPITSGPDRRKSRCPSRWITHIRKIWNVIATIPGTVEPDRWVMVGNHRDAWVYGAVDPGSGTAATLEMCRALGSAVKNGWKPRRTIVYASWDAEEYGLVGSTEWAEEHAKEVDEKAVLMLNVDSAVSGKELEMSGVPSLRDLTLDAAGSITDPRTGKSLRDAWIAIAPRGLGQRRPAGPCRPALGSRPGPESGATHEPRSRRRSPPRWAGSARARTTRSFVDHLGVPVVDAGFKGSYGVYHSIYDDFNWMEKFGDPEFLSHATAARLYTLDRDACRGRRRGAAQRSNRTAWPCASTSTSFVASKAQRVRKSADVEAGRHHRFRRASPALVEAVRAFQTQAEQLDRATEKAAASASRGPTPLGETERRARESRAGVPARRRAARPPLVQACGLRSRPHHGLRFLAAAGDPPGPRRRQNPDSKLAADVARTVERINKAPRHSKRHATVPKQSPTDADRRDIQRKEHA